MSGDNLVRAWKDPDEDGVDAAHPAGEISLDELAGGQVHLTVMTIAVYRCPPASFFWACPPRSMGHALCPFEES